MLRNRSISDANAPRPTSFTRWSGSIFLFALTVASIGLAATGGCASMYPEEKKEIETVGDWMDQPRVKP